MPLISQEGSFSGTVRAQINSALGQFGAPGASPTAPAVDVPTVGGNLFYESAQDNITAKAGGSQAAATKITGQTARITTVATAADSISLPAALAGLEVIVINHGANPVQVFGAGTDTIDDVATAVGVSQMPSSVVIYTCASSGSWYSEGLANGYAGGLQTVSALDGVTAVGASQGTATVLPARMMYNISTVGAGTGVLLPPSVAGAEIRVNNNQAANALLIYPNGSEKINALAASAGFSAAVNTATILYCFTAGQWFTK